MTTTEINTDKLAAYEAANLITAKGARAWVNVFATLGMYKGLRLIVEHDGEKFEAVIKDGKWSVPADMPQWITLYIG